MGATLHAVAPSGRRRRRAGVGAVPPITLETPKGATQIGIYQGRAFELVNTETNARTDRNRLAIGAGVALSVGLSVMLSAEGKNAQKAGAALAGLGLAAAIAALISHLRADEASSTRAAYMDAIAKAGA